MGAKYMRTVVAAVAIGAAALAGCGDDDAAGEPAATAPPTTAATTATTAAATATTAATTATTAAEPAAGTGSDDPATTTAAGVAGALVTIDGEEFPLEQQVVCVAMGGALGAQFQTADGSLSFSVDLPPPGWETSSDGWEAPSVRFDDEREDRYLQWEAGGEVLAGMNDVPDGVEVTSYTIDDRAASGAAAVVDLNSVMLGEPVTADLTFEVSCD